MLLAPGSWLLLYFELNVQYDFQVPPDVKKEHIEYIQAKYALGDSQLEKSVFKVVAGILLVKDPPGKGKTRPTLVMLRILASLDIKVLVCAGSNQAVDTLLLAFHKALKGDKKLKNWCGDYYRFRTAGYQMTSLRRISKVQSKQDHNKVKPSANEALTDCGLIEDQTTELKRCYENILIRVVAQSRVITVTPNTSGDENLNAYFNPYALLCDETDQCLEGEHLCFTNFILLKFFLLQYLSRA
ncbi:hypothetical protein N7533_009298 [Penicillium manginii]|uniref:uncharacterized protein n=1 Tax=Penicillium manginii TaxID=203109 RepID=UPI002546DC88|nr:uncharacterized protein N7533_009298 [Penicillium manginii]KAJ5744428.1 hypothetical protein N7533_009298 [Penicillium manginii]